MSEKRRKRHSELAWGWLPQVHEHRVARKAPDYVAKRIPVYLIADGTMTLMSPGGAREAVASGYYTLTAPS